jgi:hypothetical protein
MDCGWSLVNIEPEKPGDLSQSNTCAHIYRICCEVLDTCLSERAVRPGRPLVICMGDEIPSHTWRNQSLQAAINGSKTGFQHLAEL